MEFGEPPWIPSNSIREVGRMGLEYVEQDMGV